MIDTMVLKFFSFIDSFSIYDVCFSAIVYCILALFLINFLTHFRTAQETINFLFINVGIVTGAIALNRFLFHNSTYLSKSPFYVSLIFAINLATFILYNLYCYWQENQYYNFKTYLAKSDTSSIENINNIRNENETKTFSSQEKQREDQNIYRIENYNYYYQQNDDKYADPYTSKALTGDVQDIDNDNETKITKSIDEENKNENNTITNIDIVLHKKNVAQIEENLMQKVQVLINENNVKIDNRINELNENINNIGDGVQGVVNRMSKLFELINQTIKVQIKQQQEG